MMSQAGDILSTRQPRYCGTSRTLTSMYLEEIHLMSNAVDTDVGRSLRGGEFVVISPDWCVEKTVGSDRAVWLRL